MQVTSHGVAPVALTVAGSDSSGGAGIQADLKTFAALGVYGTSAIAAITAQNTVGVSATYAIEADVVVAQMEAVAADLRVAAVKTGMLMTAAIVEAVAAAVAALDLPLLVVDPVMRSTSGRTLLDDEGVAMLRAALLPRATVVTPNLPEAAALSGRAVDSPASVREAARVIHGLGPSAVIVTGGHGEGDDVIDVLFDGHMFHELRTPRVRTRHSHGTGCTFSAAVAAYLAWGYELPEAAARAQAYVAGALRHALGLGEGHGPMDHFWQTADTRPERAPR